MTAERRATLAFVTLLLLTLASWQLAESAWLVAGLALVKVLVVGLVFLELGRSHPLWALLFASAIGATLGLSAALITAAA